MPERGCLTAFPLPVFSGLKSLENIMRRFSSFAFVAGWIAVLASIPTFANPYEQNGYVKAEGGVCAVWAPTTLRRQDEYALRYSGGCKNGFAEGKGKAEWLFRYARMKPQSVWEGEFRKGIFLNGNKVDGFVEPVPGDRYLVPQGKVEDAADLFFVSRSAQNGPLELCNVEFLRLSLKPGTNVADAALAQKLMQEAGRRYRKTCPDNQQEIRVGLHTEPFKVTSNNLLPDPVAEARVDARGALAGYHNRAAETAQQEKSKVAYRQQQAESRQRFYAFSRKNGIHAWVTLQQLDENPFRWEGKTVGLRVRLDRMLMRDSARIQPASQGEWGAARLVGVTPDFPDSQHSVLVAVRVGKREALPAEQGEEYLTLFHIDSRVCEEGNCSDWLMGVTSAEVNWGKPFSTR
jgi:hypothetical protein